MQEDDLLRELVAKHGTKKWALIASKIPEKASKQVSHSYSCPPWAVAPVAPWRLPG